MRRRFWAWDGVYHGQTVFERVKILVTNSKREPLEPNEDSNYITMERTFFNTLFSMGNICFAGSLPSTHCPIACTPSPSISTQSEKISPVIQCCTCCCSMIPVHSVACDHDNTWDV